MRKRAGVLIGVAVTLFLPYYGLSAEPDLTKPLTGRIIVLDPGHAVKDRSGRIVNPGASTKAEDLYERDVTLKVAELLRQNLEKLGARVYMTRTPLNPWRYYDSQRGDNRARAVFSNLLKADVTIRLHCDWNHSKKFEGHTTYFFRWKSRDLAEDLQIAMGKAFPDRVNHGTKRKSFVSATIASPTALVEIGALSNPREAALLAQPTYLQRVSQALTDGLLTYFGPAA